jgi:hypothetical protein
MPGNGKDGSSVNGNLSGNRKAASIHCLAKDGLGVCRRCRKAQLGRADATRRSDWRCGPARCTRRGSGKVVGDVDTLTAQRIKRIPA